jgi:hypothetical protein
MLRGRRITSGTEGDMIRYVSSVQTFWMKFLLPAGWILVFGLGTLGLWLGIMHGRNNELPPEEMKWLFLFIWVAGTSALLWMAATLKRVRLDSKCLYVSNYLRETSIPLSNVKDVTENRWANYHPVTIHFFDATEFGEKITFMPKLRYFGFWRSHPIVDELKQLAGARTSPIKGS